MFIKTEKGWIEETSAPIIVTTEAKIAYGLPQGTRAVAVDTNRVFIGGSDGDLYEMECTIQAGFYVVSFYCNDELIAYERVAEGSNIETLPSIDNLLPPYTRFEGWVKENGTVIESIENVRRNMTIIAAYGKESLDNMTDADFLTENAAFDDSLGNEIVIPASFKIAADSGTSIEEGVVIEDEDGNQFVWVPIGENLITSNGKLSIVLNRYDFNETTGIPSIYTDSYLEEDSLGGTYSGKYGNTIAKDIVAFQESVAAFGGYYIGRYEASGNADQMYVKKGGTIYSSVTQPNASIAARNMYAENNYFECDLMNSFAWDSAIVYIQELGTNSNYSNSAISTTNNYSGNIGDEQLKINDIGNKVEYTTETGTMSSYPCVYRTNGKRTSLSATAGANARSFRPVIYLKTIV